MEHKPSEAQLFPWPLWPDLMVTKPCRALPRNWTVLLEQFSLQIARALISNPQMLRLVYPPMQAGSLLKPVGLPAHAGLRLDLSSPLHNVEKEWDSHPTDLHFGGEHPCWMMPVSDGSLIPVITQSSKNITHKATWSHPKVPRELIKVGQILVLAGSRAMVSPVCHPVSIPGDCHVLWDAAELCRELMYHGAFWLVSAGALWASGWQEVPRNELP